MGIQIPGKGRGLVATRTLAEGVIVIREKPILGVRLTVGDKDERLLADFGKLCDTEKARLLQMYDYQDPCGLSSSEGQGDVAAKLIRIVQVNSIRTQEKEGEGTMDVYPTACLLNHSCEPNVHWFPKQGEIVVNTLEKIEKGEELTVSYLNTSLKDYKRGDSCPTRIQRSRLLDKLLFHCICSLCKQDSAGEDLKREEVQRLDLSIEGDHSPSDLLQAALRKLEIVEELNDHQAVFIALIDCWKITEILQGSTQDEELVEESEKFRKKAEQKAKILGPSGIEAFHKFDSVKLDSI